MIKLNLQFFGGRGSSAGKRTGESTSAEKDLDSAGKALLKKLDNMQELDMISIEGFDRAVIEKAYEAGEEWAEDAMESELSGTYVFDGYDKNGEPFWEPASFMSEPPTYTRDEMIEIIKKRGKLEKRKSIIRAYYEGEM